MRACSNASFDRWEQELRPTKIISQAQIIITPLSSELPHAEARALQSDEESEPHGV